MPGLLCVSNFPANTGYAWDFIEACYAGVAEQLAPNGVRTWVAYPRLSGVPRPLAGCPALPVQLEVRFDRLRCVAATLRFVRKHNIRVVYLADRPSWSLGYLILRMAGVRRIVVHDHTSGERTVPRGVRRLMKRIRNLIPGTSVDAVIAVSDFVAQRKIRVELMPGSQVRRIWNSVPIDPPNPAAGDELRRELGVNGRMIVACACRATPEKGVHHLLRAFDLLLKDGNPDHNLRPLLVYFGDGPAMAELRALRDQLGLQGDVLLTGYRPDASKLMEGADVCVVPSVWQEAFGLAALEPMSKGVAVIASRVGGIPEIIVDGETGRLVPAGDERALAAAIGELLADDAMRRRFGQNGRRRAASLFAREEQLPQLVAQLEAGLT